LRAAAAASQIKHITNDSGTPDFPPPIFPIFPPIPGHYSALRARPPLWQLSDKFRTNYALATKMMTTTMAQMGNGDAQTSDSHSQSE